MKSKDDFPNKKLTAKSDSTKCTKMKNARGGGCCALDKISSCARDETRTFINIAVIFYTVTYYSLTPLNTLLFCCKKRMHSRHSILQVSAGTEPRSTIETIAMLSICDLYVITSL